MKINLKSWAFDTFCPQCGIDVQTDEDGCCRFCGSDAKGRAVVALRDAVLAELLDHEETKARLVTARGGNIGELVSVLRQAAKDIEAVDRDRFSAARLLQPAFPQEDPNQ